MSEPEIKTVTELKIFLNGKIDKLDDHLKENGIQLDDSFRENRL